MKRRIGMAIGFGILLLAVALTATPSVADPRVADLVQAGKIRVALFYPQFTKDQETGAVKEVGPGVVAADLARAIAARLAIKVELVGLPTPPKAIECVKTGACDVVFVGIEASRAAQVDFTPPIIQFDYTYLVPAGSRLNGVADVDKPGVRIAVVRNHGSTIALSRIVKNAKLVESEIPDAAFDALRAGNADAFASARDPLVDYSTKLPSSRVLKDGYGVNLLGMAVRKGAAGRLAYISAFTEEAKRSGLVQRAIERGGLRGSRVAVAQKAN